METLQPPDRTSARVIEAYCALLDSPAARLKFIRRAVARCQTEGVGTPSRWPFFDRFRLKKIVVEELVPLLPAGATLPLSIRAAVWAYHLRVPIYSASALAAVAIVGVLLYSGAQLVASMRAPAATAIGAAPVSAAPRNAVGPNAEALPEYAPEHIWLVEQGSGFEIYSNGARIETEFATDGPPRRYFDFPRGAATPDGGVERTGSPVGIVFHTSQSHIAPFKPEFNAKLQKSTRALLDYVRRKRLYNYVIDRFGRIYRIVPDEATADHAGNSIWANADRTYVDLSGGFLGVCFEAEWSPELQIAPDQLNEAQIIAGRQLTALLRGKHQISDANCVTHAIVSVSPASRLIGFHMDWANAFPFETLGLTDKYAVETPSIAEFGFGHDGAFDNTVGEMWPGVIKADARVAEAAAARGVSEAELRREMQKRYRTFKSWLSARNAASSGAGG